MRFAAISVFCLAVSTVVKLLTTPNGPSEVGGCSRQVPFVRRGHNTHPPFWPQLGDTAISRFAGVIFRLVCWGIFFFYQLFLLECLFNWSNHRVFFHFVNCSWKCIWPYECIEMVHNISRTYEPNTGSNNAFVLNNLLCCPPKEPVSCL